MIDEAKLKKFQQEKEELNRLIGRGMEFQIEVDVAKVRKEPMKWLKFIKKDVRVVEREEVVFKIAEPTLGTLDRMSREWLEMAIDDEETNGMDDMAKARLLVNRHAERCARVVAIAILGSKYNKAVVTNGHVKYEVEEENLDELTDVLKENVKPSLLFQVVTYISVVCNLSDFIASIRLMSTQRTTMPNRIEEKGKD